MTAQLLRCKACGNEIARNALLCPYCGTSPMLDSGFNILGWSMLAMVGGFFGLIFIAEHKRLSIAIGIGMALLLVLALIGRTIEKCKQSRLPESGATR